MSGSDCNKEAYGMGGMVSSCGGVVVDVVSPATAVAASDGSTCMVWILLLFFGWTRTDNGMTVGDTSFGLIRFAPRISRSLAFRQRNTLLRTVQSLVDGLYHSKTDKEQWR